MPDRPPFTNESLHRTSPDVDGCHDVEGTPDERTLRRTVSRPAQFLSFWLAIALPFVHLPLLVQGLGDSTILIPFLALLTLNVVALYVGHGYKQS